MKKPILFITFIVCTASVSAQSWELHLGTGLSFAKLLPARQSTPRSPIMSYGFSKRGLYFSPELDFKVNEHSRFSLCYQVSDNGLGVQFRTGKGAGVKDYSADWITLHNFAVGYSHGWNVLKDRALLGAYAKVGIAYGQITGISEGGSSGHADNSAYYMKIERMTGFDVIQNFWTPTSSIGLSAGTATSGRKILDRFTLNVGATLSWKNPYLESSKVHYTIFTTTNSYDGIAEFQGLPLQLQVGIDYNLFRFGKKV